MAVLLMRFAGPMQSWGTHSRFDERGTEKEPSKSGVLGLVCAAIGRDRAESLTDLTCLKMGVRIDREGILCKDYHTAQYRFAKKIETEISERYYLADAVFLVGLEGDEVLLNRVHQKLKNPTWPLYLGRKAFVPSPGVYLLDGYLKNAVLKKALEDYPCLVENSQNEKVRIVIESEDARTGSLRMDQPNAPFDERKYCSRFVISYFVERKGGGYVS